MPIIRKKKKLALVTNGLGGARTPPNPFVTKVWYDTMVESIKITITPNNLDLQYSVHYTKTNLELLFQDGPKHFVIIVSSG